MSVKQHKYTLHLYASDWRGKSEKKKAQWFIGIMNDTLKLYKLITKNKLETVLYIF